MLALLFSRTGALMVGLIAGIAFLMYSHNFAYQSGRQMEREALLARSVEILRERNRVDEEVRDMDAAGLCTALGGVFTDGTCQ